MTSILLRHAHLNLLLWFYLHGRNVDRVTAEIHGEEAAEYYAKAHTILVDCGDTQVDPCIRLAFYEYWAYIMENAKLEDEDGSPAEELLYKALYTLKREDTVDPKLAKQILALKKKYQRLSGRKPESLNIILPNVFALPQSS